MEEDKGVVAIGLASSEPEHRSERFRGNRVLCRKWFRTVIRLLGAICASCAVLVIYADRRVESAGAGRLFSAPAGVPPHDVALVLGTRATLPSGRQNLFFEFRMDAAAELYRSGRVRKLLVSGDNGTRGYNEPADMRLGLVERGVPADDIVLDYAGFRTLDSVVRLKEVFGQGRAVFVSQRFHLERALFIAANRGLTAVGYVARCPRLRRSQRLREILARAVAVLDCHLLRTAPRFLGPREHIHF
ncbi:vancomycin high temperature exclusion protein [Planctomycetota bacterium]